MKQTKVTIPSTALTKVERVDQEKLFRSYFGQCMMGLLCCNTCYDPNDMGTRDVFTDEELLAKASWLADRMVDVVVDRNEVEKFESKLGGT